MQYIPHMQYMAIAYIPHLKYFFVLEKFGKKNEMETDVKGQKRRKNKKKRK